MMGFHESCVPDLEYLSPHSITWADFLAVGRRGGRLSIAQVLVSRHLPLFFIHLKINLWFKAFCTSSHWYVLYVGCLFHFLNQWVLSNSCHFSYPVASPLNSGSVHSILLPKRRVTVSKTWKSSDSCHGGVQEPHTLILELNIIILEGLVVAPPSWHHVVVWRILIHPSTELWFTPWINGTLNM